VLEVFDTAAAADINNAFKWLSFKREELSAELFEVECKKELGETDDAS
jgi:hypothetical protein